MTAFFQNNFIKNAQTESKATLDSSTVNVTNWSQLKSAMNDQNITKINVENNIVNDENNSNQQVGNFIPLKSIDFNGNGYTVDFRGTCFSNLTAIPKDSSINWNIHDVTMYGQNWFVPFQANGLTSNNYNGNTRYGNGDITFKNVNYIGSQLTASYTYNINFYGENNNTSVNNYISPFDKKSYATLKNQVNIEATNIKFDEGSTYNGSTENAGVMYLYNDGKLKLGSNSKVNITSGGEAYKTAIIGGEYGRSALTIKGDLETGQNSILNIKTKPSGNQTAIDLVSGASRINDFHIDKSSRVTINDDGSDSLYKRNIVELASDTKFIVDNNATFDLNTKLNSNRQKNIINASSGSTFDIGDKGNFIINAAGTANYDLLHFARNSNFIIDNANKVDLNAQNNTNSNTNLIYMDSGYLESKIQHIYAWNRGNKGEKFDKDWANISNDFKNNFNSNNYSRLLFSYIPDINVSINNDLTSSKKDPNSSKITGKAIPGSYIRFSGDPAIPKGTLKGQSSSNNNLYHVQTDKNGSYSYTLPAGKHFTAKSNVSAYGYLNGKSDSTSRIVKQTPSGSLNNYLTDNKNVKKLHLELVIKPHTIHLLQIKVM